MNALRRTLLSITLAAAVATGWAAPAGATGDDDDPGIVPFDIGTYNIRADRTLKQFKNAVDAFKEKVQVAGLQEIAEKEKNDYLQSDEGWGYYRPDELRQNPVIWDTTYFSFVDAPDSGYQIAKGREVEAKDGGTEFKEATFATVVRLDHLLSGNEVSIINVHLLSGASRVGMPWPGRPKRFEMLTDQVAGMMRLVKAERELGNEVFVLGDFNIGFQADQKVRDKRLPFKRFKRVGYRSMWQGGELAEKGTYENAYLDQVWSTEVPTQREVAYDIKQSDHYPAVARYDLDLELPFRLG
jgi:exonuclease III